MSVLFSEEKQTVVGPVVEKGRLFLVRNVSRNGKPSQASPTRAPKNSAERKAQQYSYRPVGEGRESK